MKMLQDNAGNISSMRVSLILITIGILFIFAAVSVYIVLFALNPKDVPAPPWAEMGAFLAGVAGVITGAGWNKVKQKRIENENK
jgi:hypothetical protein